MRSLPLLLVAAIAAAVAAYNLASLQLNRTRSAAAAALSRAARLPNPSLSRAGGEAGVRRVQPDARRAERFRTVAVATTTTAPTTATPAVNDPNDYTSDAARAERRRGERIAPRVTGRKFHTCLTANGAKYVEWQTRIAYHYWKEMKAKWEETGGSCGSCRSARSTT